MECQKNHRYLPEYLDLPNSQDNQRGDRHACAGCAYELGLKDGTAHAPKRNNLSNLPRSQAGTVRHKGAMESYLEGYAEGYRRSS